MTVYEVGTPGHAEEITRGRHPGVSAALAWLTFSHLPPVLQPYSRTFYLAAMDVIHYIKMDSAELTTALNKLIEAKDAAVRAGIRMEHGRPGSVPRPAEVADPPMFAAQQSASFPAPRPIRDNPRS